MGYDVSHINDQPSITETTERDTYFANLGREELGRKLMDKVDDYANFINSRGRMAMWQKSSDQYFRGWLSGATINKIGQQGEYSSLYPNEYRNILLHLLVGVTSNKLSPEPKAANTDYKSQAQTVVASGVLEHYNRILNLDQEAKATTEYGLVFTEGWMSVEWDADAGESYGVSPDGRSQKSGDIVINKYTPMDVIRDYTVDSIDKHQWFILRDWKNKFDLAAKYPDLADRILRLNVAGDQLRNNRMYQNRIDDSDLVPVYKFYHKKSSAVPEGKFTEFLEDDIITIDGPLPYDEAPVYKINPESQIKSAFGYSVAYDLLPLQEAINGLYSIVMTNQSTFGVQNIAMPTGANINANTLAEGLNLITYDPKFGAPQALNLVQTPAEIFNFIDKITSRMETIAGLNSVVRGNPEASLKSGAALALVASQAIQFNSGLSQAYASFIESVWTAIINILKRYSTTPRIAVLAGKSNRSRLMQFKGDDLSNISRVTVEMGSPLSRTMAGKLQLADNLLQSQLIKDPEQYITVATTGRLEPLVECDMSQLQLIKAENEEMAEGKPQAALATDDHRLHIREHSVVLSSPEARQDPNIVAITLAHLQEHINLGSSIDPFIAALNSINGQPPMPNAGAPNASPVMDATNPVVQQAQQVNLPNQPTNPLTGEQYAPQGGAN